MACSDQAPRPYSIAGMWDGAVTVGSRIDSLHLTLEQSGEFVTGTGSYRVGLAGASNAFTVRVGSSTLRDSVADLVLDGPSMTGNGTLRASYRRAESNARRFTANFTTNCCRPDLAGFTFDGTLARR